MYFHYFVNISPWERKGLFHLNSIIYSSSKGGQCQVSLKFVQWFWRRRFLDRYFFWTKMNSLYPRTFCEKFGWNWPRSSIEEDFKISSVYFRYIVIISAWKWAWHFIWTILNILNAKMLCASFGWSWPSGSEKIFKFSLLRNYLRLKMRWPFIWTNKSPSPKDALCQVWLKLGNWFGEEDFKTGQCVFAIS